ncbi:PQQ-dependent sugar dehydrogenase [Algoriphagus machipongonensis]|uniref:Transcriptional regulator, Crp/Fnr family n=1 Tax=Algoriphagus machipongonensis TaxID=388413 RepID=A3HUH4_9BACT|nr:PQQ-dependent sugar dehydrogenase [Algoriphagus machipongonensis]EAZ81796.1 transcriptional regulator, Crp/Fnr family [Algoriphagus machipongonensis]
MFSLNTRESYFTLMAFLLIFALGSCKESKPTDDPTVKPEENRFTKVVLTEGMDEPMEMTFLPNSRILFVERKGGVKILDEKTGELTLVTTIPVNTKYTNKEGAVREAEEGLMGVIAHPDFEQNHWVYLYYADPVDTKHVLARYELQGNELVESSKKILLEIPTQREECCHTGGGMAFDQEGNLFLTVGNNTANPRLGTSNLDERPGHENADDQRAPGNTNDLRGKILRIHPEDDGTYSIPEGNLFPVGTEKTRPEIYTMGHRNPWRPTIDSETGYLYWGEVGPDASIDSIWGPRGYDEFNQAKGPGFFGWPYFIGNNYPYTSHDYETETFGEFYDVNNPVNESVNNTGLRELPTPVIPAFIWYPYGVSEEFPLVGSSGRSATGGPVFRKADFAPDAPFTFPAYYEGKWLIVEFMRGWIMSVSMDENGDYQSMERFLPNDTFSSAIDMDFGPDGALYVLEYGSAWFRGNSNSRIVKIEYNAGNRKPNVHASADKLAGAIPFTTNFSAEGTNDFDDYDEGNLKYSWAIKSSDGSAVELEGPNPSYTFENAGEYQATLTVTDTKGESNSASLDLIAGNEEPVVIIDFDGKNRTFYFGESSLNYQVQVSDKEDGSSADGSIKANEVAVTFDYVPAGFDPIEIASKQSGAESMAVLTIGKNLIESSDCKSCHQYDKASIGPSYQAVADKYENTAENVKMLVGKVINGGSGVWGDHAMSAHPQLSESDVTRMVDYIMNMNELKPTVESLPLAGSVNAEVPEGEDGEGGYLLRAFYTDKGSGNTPSLTGEDYVALRNPFLDPQLSADRKGVQLLTTPRVSFSMIGDQSYFSFKDIDMTGIKEIMFYLGISDRVGAIGASVEVRLDSPTGELLGETEKVTKAPAGGGFRPPEGMTMTEWRRQLSATPSTKISEVSGTHDIYFIFKNSEAAPDQVLVSVNEVEFKNK